MSPGRWEWLAYHAPPDDPGLTEAEKAEGYHWCPDWDFILIGPGFPELEGCTCNAGKH